MTSAPGPPTDPPARSLVDVVAGRVRTDRRLRAALTYGSVVQSLDDAYSDAEFWIFTDQPLDGVRRWIVDVLAPAARVVSLVDTEFGGLVAILAGGRRVEFHLSADVDAVAGWPHRGAPVAAMVLLDRDGTLTAALSRVPERAAVDSFGSVAGRLVNWWLLGWNVLGRGEYERAHDALGHLRRQLLWLARLRHGATERWLTPSRLAETDLPAAELADLAAVSSTVDAAALRTAYVAAWALGRRWWAESGDTPPAELVELLDRLVGAPDSTPGPPAGGADPGRPALT